MADRILIVEENEEILAALAETFAQVGYSVDVARKLPEAARKFAVWGHKIVVLDLLLTGQGVHQLMSGILGAMPRTRVIVTTASGSMKQAAEAIGMGAFDFLVKPFDGMRLLQTVKNALASLNAALPLEAAAPGEINEIYPCLDASVKQFIAQIAPSKAPVLLKGPKGTMKEKCARLFHNLSAHSSNPFVAIDCAANRAKSLSDLISDEVLYHGGTLFLNDICDLTLKVQTQLLWFLQTGLLNDRRRLPRQADVRVICGASTQPEKAMQAGLLREDLFYRLSVASLDLPPLTNGPFTVALLAQGLLSQQARALGKHDIILNIDVKEMLNGYSWPGNMAELVELIEVIASDSSRSTIEPETLPKAFQKACNLDRAAALQSKRAGEGHLPAPPCQDAPELYETALKGIINEGKSLAEIERAVIELTIRLYQGSIPRAANHLAVSPSTIYRKMDSWGKS
ncbi:sigma 54-interacting transcriptional regulator [Roseobacter sp. N2S]|uniref:sigma-54-dependent transcriptional regulator n=1 Tax=Roseobacter sp. N2S TaxID=2663844 RepID=UPI00285642A0|nr:sigma 54-interacting transcriptional regulator [Roseobacter sp. N2S]MDR6264551.1 DNA-binding NtrC family response regulator [Roseobacter sp. N2S]